MPLHPEGHPAHLPGAVTIRLMGLGTEAREELIIDRCRGLRDAWHCIEQANREDAAAAQAARDELAGLQSDAAPQAGCVRALVAAFARDTIATARVMADVNARYRQLVGRRG